MRRPFFGNGGNRGVAERGGSGAPDPLKEVPQSLSQEEYRVTNTRMVTRMGYPHDGNKQRPVRLGKEIVTSTMRKPYTNLQEAQDVADELNSQKPLWQRLVPPLRAKVIKVERNY